MSPIFSQVTSCSNKLDSCHWLGEIVRLAHHQVGCARVRTSNQVHKSHTPRPLQYICSLLEAARNGLWPWLVHCTLWPVSLSPFLGSYLTWAGTHGWYFIWFHIVLVGATHYLWETRLAHPASSFPVPTLAQPGSLWNPSGAAETPSQAGQSGGQPLPRTRLVAESTWEVHVFASVLSGPVATGSFTDCLLSYSLFIVVITVDPSSK